MDSIMKKLKHMEYPMNWDLLAIRESAKVDHIVERLKERLEENTLGQTWKTLNMLLFLSFEFYMAENSTFEFISYLRHSEEIIEKNYWLQKYSSAAKHVLYSMWAHSFLKMNLQRSEFYLTKVKPYQEMSKEETAFILTIKASFYMMYGPPGNSSALKIFSEVLALNQDEPEWWFLKGKCLARMRRLHYRSRPTAEEITSFKKAVEMEEDSPRYLIHLARSKADLSSQLTHNKSSINDFKVIEALNTDVESLLRKAVSLSVDSSHLICHIAKSFMKLPHYFRVRNRNLTRFCVLQALSKSPTDPMVNHTVGLYSLMQNDVESAVYFLTEASNMGVYGASFDLCRLKWREYGKYDPVPDLTEVIEKNDKYACSEAHGLLATYYFFVKNDLSFTIVHWKNWEHCRDKESYLITSMFLGQESFDFSSALYDEVRLEFYSTRYNNPEDMLRFNEVLKIIEENRPKLKLEKPRRQRQYLIDKAQMVSKIGRAFPDSIAFMLREQREKKKGKKGKKKTEKEEKGNDEIAKRGKKTMYVSSKYRGYIREKKVDKNADGRKEETRSQSASRAHEYGRKSFETPFWPPPRRHRSVECINQGRNSWSGWDEKKNDGPGMSKTETRKSVGSGRIHSDNSKANLLLVKAASMESLLKSYEPKKRSHNWRSSSQESLLSKCSTGKEFFEKRTFGNTRMNSDEAESSGRELNNRRYTSLRDTNSVRPMRQPSICEDVQTSTQTGGDDTRRSWRQKEDAGADLASPKSSYFQAWPNRDDNRPSSRASSVSEESSWNKNGGNDSRSSSRSTFRNGGTPTSAFFQSRNRWDQEDRFGSSSRVEQSDVTRTCSRPSPGRREDVPKSPFFQSSDRGDEGGRVLPSCSEQSDSVRTSWRPRGFGNAPTSAFFQSWNQSGRGDRVNASPRTSSVEEDRDRCQSGNSSSGSSAMRHQDVQSRFRGREGYTPRGGSFSRGRQRDPRTGGVNFREAQDVRFWSR